jgi:hypothetical protein
MTEKTKKIIIPGATLAVSAYLSFLFAVGLALGYFGANFFCKKYIYTGKVKTACFRLEDWEVHIHHWIYGTLIVLAICWFGYLPSLPNMFLGALLGLILHDLYTDKVWYKVIYRK